MRRPYDWNQIVKDNETDVEAVDGDIVEFIGGYAFLLQRKCDINNIVVYKTADYGVTCLQAFKMFRDYIKSLGITHIRIEGNTRRYGFLAKAFPYDSILKDLNRKDRNIYYVRLS